MFILRCKLSPAVGIIVAQHRLRTNQPLTTTDLEGLKKTLAEIGEEEGDTLLTSLVEHNDAPSLAWFVKSMVGMERTAAQSAFADVLNDRSLNAQQMRFVEMVIDQLTAPGHELFSPV